MMKRSGKVYAKSMFGNIELKLFNPYTPQKFRSGTLSIKEEIDLRMSRNKIIYEKNGGKINAAFFKKAEAEECANIIRERIFDNTGIIPKKDAVIAFVRKDIIADIDCLGTMSRKEFIDIIKAETRFTKIFKGIGKISIIIALAGPPIKLLSYIIYSQAEPIFISTLVISFVVLLLSIFS